MVDLSAILTTLWIPNTELTRGFLPLPLGTCNTTSWFPLNFTALHLHLQPLSTSFWPPLLPVWAGSLRAPSEICSCWHQTPWLPDIFHQVPLVFCLPKSSASACPVGSCTQVTEFSGGCHNHRAHSGTSLSPASALPEPAGPGIGNHPPPTALCLPVAPLTFSYFPQVTGHPTPAISVAAVPRRFCKLSQTRICSGSAGPALAHFRCAVEARTGAGRPGTGHRAGLRTGNSALVPAGEISPTFNASSLSKSRTALKSYPSRLTSDS